MNTKQTLRSVAAITMSALMISTSGVVSVFAEKSEKDITSVRNEIGPEMDISHVSGTSREDFCYALENCPYDYNGVLGDNAEFIWDGCQEYGLNEWAIAGIIAGESGWCTSSLATKRHNIMSIRRKGGYVYFDSYEDCIEYSISLIGNSYVNPNGRYHTGGVLSDIGYTYAGAGYADDWADLVSSCAYMCTASLGS